jgi:hypothetical protein
VRGRDATEKAGSECVLVNVLVAHLTPYANDGPRRTWKKKLSVEARAIRSKFHNFLKKVNKISGFKNSALCRIYV